MMLTHANSTKTKIIIDQTTHTITLLRKLDCKPQEAFNAWTRPEQVALWWDPSGKRLRVCKIDLKVGGAFSFIHDHNPPMPPFSGTYIEIIAGERVVFDAMGAVGTVTLDKFDDGTRMTVKIACRNAEHLEQFVKMGVDKGTAQTLDNLAVYVAKGAA